MASRDVQLRLTSTGLDALIAKFDDFSAKLDALIAKVDGLSLSLDKLGKKDVTPTVDIKGVDSSLAKVAALNAALDSVGKKKVGSTTASVATSIPKDVADAVAQDVFTQFPGLGNPQRGGAPFAGSGSVFRSSVYGRYLPTGSDSSGGGLFSAIRTRAGSGLSSLGSFFGLGSTAAADAAQAAEGAAGAAGGGGGAGGGGITGFFGQAAGPMALWGGLGGLALTIAPAIIPALLGGGVGLGGALGAMALGNRAHTNLLTLQQNVQSAQQTLQTASPKSASYVIYQQRLAQAQQKLATYQQANAPALQSYTAFSNFGRGAENTFFGALTSNASRPVGETAGGKQLMQQIPNSSFLSGMTGILQQMGGFLKSIGPDLGQMFRSALPSLRMFVTVFEQLVKQFLPAFTQMFKQIQPFLPIIMQGFNALTRGLTGFMHQLGPGMKASAIDFKGIMIAVEGILIALGWLATNIALTFEGFGRALKATATFIVKAWNAVWDFFKNLVDSITHWFSNLPSSLKSIGRNMLQGLIDGMKSIPVIGTVVTIGQGIISAFRSVLHINSPSLVMHEIGMGIGEGLGNGIDASAAHVLGKATNLAQRIPGAFAAAGGAGAGRSSGAPLPIALHLNLNDNLMQVISKQIRVAGGDPRILIRKVQVV